MEPLAAEKPHLRRDYSQATLNNLEPVVTREITPKLVATRERYEDLFKTIQQEEGEALNHLKTMLESVGGGKFEQRLSRASSSSVLSPGGRGAGREARAAIMARRLFSSAAAMLNSVHAT